MQRESALRRRSVPHAGRSNSPPRTPSTKATHSIRVKRCIPLARSFVSRTATRSCGAQATSTQATLSLEADALNQTSLWGRTPSRSQQRGLVRHRPQFERIGAGGQPLLPLKTNAEESMHLVRNPPAGTRLSRAGVVIGLKQARHVPEFPGAYRPGVVLQTHIPARSGRQDQGSTRRSTCWSAAAPGGVCHRASAYRGRQPTGGF